MRMWWIGAATGVFIVASLSVASFWARSPADLEPPAPMESLEPVRVKIPEAPKAEESLPPPPPSTQESLLDLAPPSMSGPQDLGVGVGFQGQGGGPGVGGQGGFGADSNSVVREQGQVDHPPRAVLKTPPDYPNEARARGVAGFVLLKILIGANGSIENIQIEKSEPPGFFEQAALDAIKRWRFDAGVRQGKALAAWTTQKVKFELN